MLTVYRVEVAPSAPRIVLETETAQQAGVFDGSGKALIFEDRPLRATIAQVPLSDRQFVALAAGVLVLPERAWENADDMYYCCSMGNELLAIKTPSGNFVGINPLEVLPQAKAGSAPCVVDQFYAPLFRIAGRDPMHLFCVEGLGADQFKLIYEELGFSGLLFEAIWQGEAEM